MIDIRETDPGFNKNQHCTFPEQDGVLDYSFSHTAQYCGRPQPRRCGCPFDYSGPEAVSLPSEVTVNDLILALQTYSSDTEVRMARIDDYGVVTYETITSVMLEDGIVYLRPEA